MPKGSTAPKVEDEREQQGQADEEQIRRRLKQIEHQIIVLSGKGGVGKSTVAANLAVSLVLAGKRVGLLDIDIHGPSIPRILNLEGKRVESMGRQIMPIEVMPNFKVMSIGFLLPGRDDPVIWRGPMKYHIIKQFLKDVEWGTLDFLIIDSPPGTGDEPLSVIQLLENADGAIVVTTPQEVALADVRKGIAFCRSLNLPVLGVLENMSGFVCPKCGERTDIFKSGGGKNMAMRMAVPFLGTIPIDPWVVQTCDLGRPFVRSGDDQSETVRAFGPAVQALLDLDQHRLELT
jgi:ATP-binding protein involved in chromosome partitioning